MSFKNPNIQSSYRQKQMGKILYDAVLESSAKKIFDIGILKGYSTVCLAQAAKQTGGIVYAYDLFEDYKYNSSTKEIVEQNLKKYNVFDYVRIKKCSLEDWLNLQEKFDVLHVDISNTGETIEKLYHSLKNQNGRVFFEGGSKKRDEQDWMIQYRMKKFSDLGGDIKFKVLSEDSIVVDGRKFYPSISELYLR